MRTDQSLADVLSHSLGGLMEMQKRELLANVDWGTFDVRGSNVVLGGQAAATGAAQDLVELGVGERVCHAASPPPVWVLVHAPGVSSSRRLASRSTGRSAPR